ncbi:metallophosphoesterase [Candidatus Bathyarchaeota archaeon]|nr:metallophosphoesterase [Candidatus Bathyarchaeota archaeon]
MIKLLTPYPALMVESDERVMMVADLHLGLEYELAKQGINIPYQWNRILEELMVLLEEHRPDRLVMLGDVKHGVPSTSFQEKREIPLFFETLLEVVENIDITRGNHDANIQKYLPEEVTLHSSKGIIFGDEFKVAAMHGHAWPKPEIMTADAVIMAHNHPTVMLNTPIGVRITRPVWIRGTMEPENLARAFLALDNVKLEEEEEPLNAFYEEYGFEEGTPELIVMPMFNDLLGGLPVNSESPESLLGPLFRGGIVDMNKFDAYLQDGSYLGKVGFLRKRLEGSL